MLVLSRKKDEKIIIDDKIKVTVLAIEGNQVQIGIDAPQDIEIYREELYRKIEEENREATGKRKDLSKLKGLTID